MLINQEIEIKELAVHQVGNKLREEGLILSHDTLVLNDNIKSLLTQYFLKPFKSYNYYNLSHESNIELNEIYSYVTAFFEQKSSLLEQSIKLAKHLYEKVSHPQVKSGEFYVVHFSNCFIEGESVDAIGLFKSENKETYLKVYPAGNNFEIDKDAGININKLDKGCIVFNSGKKEGYLVSIVDNINRGEEAQYWKDSFLQIKLRKDSFHQTEQALKMCKEFVNHLPEEFEISKVDQVNLLNNASNYFKEEEKFKLQRFEEDVLGGDENVKESFNNFRSAYTDEQELVLDDEFRISETAVKKQQKIFKSILKLDKNFHLYIHGNRNLIEKGYDADKEMNFYKIYFHNEK